MDWAILFLSALSAAAGSYAAWYTYIESMPSFRLINVLDKDSKKHIYRFVVINNRVARITNYGYVDFNNKVRDREQEITQYTTYTNIDWGQKFEFENMPPSADIYYFYVLDISRTMPYKFYPNGLLKSLVIKYLLRPLCLY